jgi:solute carrier family 6 amino acid/orphan transporter-like 15/16/17/18/20
MNSNFDVCDSNFRPRWMNRGAFLLAAVGSSIGLGNIWKFPYLTWKHGGTVFVLAYLIALVFVGIPMLILELTLGQKMQRGSAGAIRGILPRFAGAGWAAAFAAIITAVIYILLLAIVLLYLVNAGVQPWKQEHYEPTRPAACNTAAKAAMTSEELFLYMNVTGLYDPNTCEPFSVNGESKGSFAQNLYHCTQVIWFFMFLATIKGPKSLGICSVVTATLPFIFLFACMGGFMALNANPTGMATDDADFIAGDGLNYYWGYKEFPLPPGADGKATSYDPSTAIGSLMQDAYGQVFFSVGVCVGVMFAYGSYNPVR